MRKGAITMTAATLLATAFVAATPIVDSAPANDITVVGEALLATPAALTTATGTSTTNDCTDTAYALQSWHLAGGTFNWYYNAAGAPAAVTYAALTTISRATANVVTGQNRCGLKPVVSMSQSYMGSTTKAAQVSSTSACTGNDGVSVTSWGVLPTNTLGYTCAYYRTSTGALLSSDLMLNSTKKWFTGAVPAGCTDSFDLESVVVHERGHTAGLSHVDQTASAQQTMSPRTLACTTYKRLLGSGDVRGLRALAGTL